LMLSREITPVYSDSCTAWEYCSGNGQYCCSVIYCKMLQTFVTDLISPYSDHCALRGLIF